MSSQQFSKKRISESYKIKSCNWENSFVVWACVVCLGQRVEFVINTFSRTHSQFSLFTNQSLDKLTLQPKAVILSIHSMVNKAVKVAFV